MKAAIYKKYGPPEVLKIEEIERPSIQDNEVLVKVHSASVNPYDYLFRKGYLPVRMLHGFIKPKRQLLGVDVAGEIELVGKNVRRFKVGDPVFGFSGVELGYGGSHTEYARIPQSIISIMPKNLTFEEAAAVPLGALTALQALRDKAEIKKGHKVLIYGASGGVGTFAVQLARIYETELTAVCSSSNFPWVEGLGSHYTIDYTQEDFTEQGNKYDIIFDAVGKLSFFSCRRSLNKTGVYITANVTHPKYHIIQLVLSSLIGRKRAKTLLTKPNDEDLDFIRKIIEEEKIKPVIDRCYPLDQIVEAHRYAEKGHTKGKVVIEIQKG